MTKYISNLSLSSLKRFLLQDSVEIVSIISLCLKQTAEFSVIVVVRNGKILLF